MINEHMLYLHKLHDTSFQTTFSTAFFFRMSFASLHNFDRSTALALLFVSRNFFSMRSVKD